MRGRLQTLCALRTRSQAHTFLGQVRSNGEPKREDLLPRGFISRLPTRFDVFLHHPSTRSFPAKLNSMACVTSK